MKKTVIALATTAALGASVATIVQAASQANTFYAGAKAGWASVRHGLNQYQYEQDGTVVGKAKKNSESYGIFAGYQITDNFAVEAGYEFFGRGKVKEATGEKRITAHGSSLSLKASYPVLHNLDLYARAGAALIRVDYKDNTFGETHKFHDLKVSPVFAGGLEYAILPELALRLEYQWVSRVGNFGKAERKANYYENNESDVRYSPDIGSVALGLSYRFGQGPAPVIAPEVVNKVFNLNSDVTFAFNKANLKPQAQKTLDGISHEIAQVNNANVQVAGYTDRIGSDAYNQKLSQRRAETVANYLVSKGVSQQAISATGYGKANPVTGNKCDTVKGRKALIACLADDRRVEIAVNGTK
ncbi:porin OmpA [Aggregatibacter actinomycetemcomitans]|uniref:porin OmpA n=1 Tax=Aggregatibacter actinomycetemcomitans TaxID=714 RepID=UPI001E45AA9D|nr:porin OmpA [Aggregatibacter actinomycetemcomitans]